MKFNKTQLLKLKRALLNLGEIHTEDGMLVFDGSELEVGIEVFTDGEEGLVPATDGEYHYDGKTVTVVGGKVESIMLDEPEVTEPEIVEDVIEEVADEFAAEETEETEETDDETVTEETEETDVTEDDVTEDDVTEDEPEPAVDEEKEAMKARIAELEALVEELNGKLEEPVADDPETELKRQNKCDEKKNKMNYVAMVKKAKEINK